MNAHHAEPVKTQAVVLAGAVMTEVASKMSAKFDSFGSWLLAGYGAGLALLLDGHEVARTIPTKTMKLGVELFLFSVVVMILEKYLAIIVVSSAESAALSRKELMAHFKEQKDSGVEVSFDVQGFIQKLLLGLMPPFRVLAGRLIAKILSSGDFSLSGQRLLRMAQFQGILILVQVILFLIALLKIACTLPNT